MTKNKELSEREREILSLVAGGASNKEIAESLVISINTVKVHLRNIYSKLDISSRSEATLYAVSEGLITPIKKNRTEGEEFQKRNAIYGYFSNIWNKPLQRFLFILFVFVAVALGGVGVFYGFRQLVGISKMSNEISNADTEMLRWHEHAPMSVPRRGLALVDYNERIYAIGGETLDGTTGSVEVYDPEKDIWHQLSSKPTPVHDITAGVIGGKIYVPGGMKGDGSPTNVLEIYSPLEDTWEIGNSLPISICAYGAATFEGQLYVFGGWDGKSTMDTVFVYDPSRDQWSQLSPMLQPRAYHSVAVVDGKIYIIGGQNGDEILSAVDVYSPEADRGGGNPWTTVQELPQARKKMGALSVANVIYIFGGEGKEGDILPPLRYFPQQDKWEEFTEAGQSTIEEFGLSLLGTEIYIVGGVDNNKNTLNKTVSYEAIYVVQLPVIR